MKRNTFSCWFRLALFVIAAVSFLNIASVCSAADPKQPSILSVRLDGTNVVVVVQVPAGITKVTLENRARIATGSWAPSMVKRLSNTGGTMTFVLPISAKLEMLRVRADVNDALPASFYQGSNTFNGPVSSSGDIRSLNAPTGALDSNAPGTGAETKSTRSVEESDIWKIQGSTLYFFNQLRGLHVIDITKPETPVVTGTLNLPAAGEQMYVLDDATVVLLARDGNYYNYSGTSDSESKVLVVKVTNGIPAIAATLPVNGYIQESRLVGTALYVASQTYQPIVGKTDGSWEWGTQVSSYDLSDTTHPVSKGTLWYSGYGNVVSASDQFLFVATTDTANWRSSNIRCVDISAPDGTMQALATIVPTGYVADKFKMNINGDVFAVISQMWSTTQRWTTTLETFSLANPSKPLRLGIMNFVKANGEQLHATRFDGNRVYVVTFFQVDPLWVVDISDPVNPSIKGELQVPGWSTYIEPLGNRLVTIGIDNSNGWKVAVSLFNVEDPTKPSLISKVPLGDGYSWSEANYDEKAFGVLPDSGLILVPYQGYFTNGYASRVQLIDLFLNDLSTNALKARGTIDHQFQPRRATVYQNSILSISGQELLSVDASNRDHPVVRSVTELAWAVNRLLVQGNYLIEMTVGSSWNSQTIPALRVTSANDPSTVLTEVDLTNGLPIAGAVIRNGQLFIAQAGGNNYLVMTPAANGTNTDGAVTNPPPLVLSVYGLASLPALPLLGQVQAPAGDPIYSSLQAVWPKDGLLIWVGGGYNYYPYAMDSMEKGGLSIMRPYPWYYGGGGGRLLAFDVSDGSKPKFQSDLNLTTNNWWSFSSAFNANGLVYVSHQASEFLPGVKSPYPPTPIVVTDPVTGKSITNDAPIGAWVQRYYLDVVDYADPTTPTMRKPVNIPGTLQGLGYNGALIFTMGYHYASDGSSDWSQWLDASAYDGVSASLVNSMALSVNWPHPLLISGASIFIGRPDYSTNQSNAIETWVFPENGKFTPIGTFGLASPANTMSAFGDLLVAQDNQGTYQMLDATVPAQLKLVGSGHVGGYLWGNLSQADGILSRGLWLPLDDYGVWMLPVQIPNP